MQETAEEEAGEMRSDGQEEVRPAKEDEEMTFSMRIRRSSVVLLVALGVLGYLVVPVSSALAYTAGPPPPYLACFNSSEADLLSLEHSLSPASSPTAGGTVPVGAAVTFSGNSVAPVTFGVASSPALLSSPDIDSGLGSAQPEGLYTFISTKVTATPVTVYWDASFSNATLPACEGMTASTYTTAVRTLAVLPAPSPPTTAVIPTTAAVAPPVPFGNISLVGFAITVQSSGKAAIKLTCTGTATCAGKLRLTVRTQGKSKISKTKTETIGAATFSIPASTTGIVKLELDEDGHTLLRADHGRLSASLTALKSSPAPSQTHTENVQLVQQKPAGTKKK
jgi:hypothetical protein